jgi:hypothetical protein
MLTFCSLHFLCSSSCRCTCTNVLRSRAAGAEFTVERLIAAKAKSSDNFDSITGFKLVDYVPVLKCGECGRRVNDWRKGSTQDSQVRQCGAFDAIVAKFGETCPCGSGWTEE